MASLQPKNVIENMPLRQQLQYTCIINRPSTFTCKDPHVGKDVLIYFLENVPLLVTQYH